jgi:hypothetical protein
MVTMESKMAKYAFWGVIIAAVITGGIGLYIHLDGKSEPTVTTKQIRENKKMLEEEKPKDTTSLYIRDLYVPPINTALDSSFYMKIENSSYNAAKDVSIRINFGKASISSCETLPDNVFTDKTKFETSIVSISVGEIPIKDEFFVYCHLSHPAFDSILISGSNLYSSKEYTYKEYIDKFEPILKDEESGFVTFFKVVGTIVAVIFIGFFTIMLISFISKKLEPHVE